MSEVRDAILNWYESYPGAEATVIDMAATLGLKELTVYRQMRNLDNEGLLSYRPVMSLSDRGRPRTQFVYSTTSKFKPRPKQPGMSIVQSALRSRGALLDAWWPIYASNDQERTAA